jgi:hypothetical protein
VEHAPRESAGPQAAESAVGARAPGGASLLGAAGLTALDRMDAGSRARTVAALQARHGNAWVGRRLMRRALPTGTYAYDRATWVRKRPPPGQLPKESDKSPFLQVVAAHEFGHLINLRHINEDLKSGPDEYGGTYEQANDVMGYGSAVSRRDYEPWLRIGEAYAGERLPGMRVTWSAVEQQW